LILLSAGQSLPAQEFAAPDPPFRIEAVASPNHAALADCPADPDRNHGPDWFVGSGAWRIVITRDLTGDAPLALALTYPFNARFQILPPGAETVQLRATFGPQRDPRWPARLSVVTLPLPVAAGQVVELCAEHDFGRAVDVRIMVEPELRAATYREDMTHAAVLGTLVAMAVAGIGMTLAIGNTTFLMISSGLLGALLYLVASRGTIHELPLLAQLAPDWAMHKLGGNLAILAFGVGLSRLIRLKTRHPRITRALNLALVLVAALLLALLVPDIGRADWTATAGNLLLLTVSGLLFGTAAVDALRGHRPSRVLLLAWSPPFLVASCLTIEIMLGASILPLVEVLLPATLAISSAVLFFGLAEEISQVRLQRDSAEQRADHDDLTGALARGAFDHTLELVRRRALNRGHPLAVLFIDIDHFKRVNDNFGHQVGDRALVAVVRAIESCLRDRDPLGRYGGEEFLVALAAVDTDEAVEIAERIRAAVEHDGAPLQPGMPPVTVSIGVAMLDHHADEQSRALVERADSALRWCKSNGRNRVRLEPCRDDDSGTEASMGET